MLIRPFMSSFSFLSSFQTLTIFVTFFSGTVRPRRFKLGTHMNDGQMCPVHRNQATDEYLSFCFFIYLSLQFQTLTFFVTFFSGTVRPIRLKVCTLTDRWELYRVYWNQADATAYSSLYFFIFLSLQFSNIKIFRHNFLKNCEA